MNSQVQRWNTHNTEKLPLLVKRTTTLQAAHTRWTDKGINVDRRTCVLLSECLKMCLLNEERMSLARVITTEITLIFGTRIKQLRRSKICLVVFCYEQVASGEMELYDP